MNLPVVIYVPDLATATLWKYIGMPDNIASRYSTYYRLEKLVSLK